eukprot:scaffold64090_cov91-Cyclotella_meneghiniana.AAC.1
MANYPLTQDMIDIEECGLKIETINPRIGKCVFWERCWQEGAIIVRKLNLLMAISEDQAMNMEWHDMWQQSEGGITFFRY